MGTFGTDISANDLYKDLEIEFFDLYNKDKPIEEIYSFFISKENLENITEETHDFWFAIADLLWQCNGLDTITLNIIKEIIESERDLKYWEQLNASKEDINERKKVLKRFLKRISVPRKHKRKKEKLYNSIFKKGDCVTYINYKNKYNCAIVLYDEIRTKYAINLFLITNISQNTKPTMKDLYLSSIELIYEKDKFNYGNELVLGGSCLFEFGRGEFAKKNITIIGKVELLEDKIKDFSVSSSGNIDELYGMYAVKDDINLKLPKIKDIIKE